MLALLIQIIGFNNLKRTLLNCISIEEESTLSLKSGTLSD